jgi:HD superfamily phosphohydrolase
VVKTLRIRDPIHGYVAVTTIERELLDQPVTQRLRWVAQSGMAQLVFPEVRTSRFTHSLGAMHLASRFLVSALRNATPPARARLQQGFREAIQLVDEDVTLGEQVVARLQDEGLLTSVAVDAEYAAEALVVEQALRLAALFHDLGHLPFSHDFEYVVRAVVSGEAPETPPFSVLVGSKPPHELIGYSMAGLLLKSVYDALMQQPGLTPVVSPAFKLARAILRAGAPGALRASDAAGAALEVLHDLIDGELDVDRTDYLLRDARAYGFDYVTFDLDRLVDNVAVAEVDGGGMAIVVRAQGQAAAESFLISRFRMYQWGVFHHKVVQVGAALQHSTRRLLDGVTRTDHQLHGFFVDIALLADDSAPPGDRKQALQRLPDYDDVWWLSRLRALPPGPWTELVLLRAKGPTSLWKRVAAFPLGPGGLVELNRRLPRRGETDRQIAWDAVVAKIYNENEILVSRAALTPYRVARNDDSTSSLQVLVGDDQLVPLSEVSTMIKVLNDAWMNELQVYASSPTAVNNPDLAGYIAQQILDALPVR